MTAESIINAIGLFIGMFVLGGFGFLVSFGIYKGFNRIGKTETNKRSRQFKEALFIFVLGVLIYGLFGSL